jgi:hypothetical protein
VNLLAHWTNVFGTNTTIQAGGGRTTGSCIRFIIYQNYLEKVLDQRQTWGIALATRWGGAVQGGTGQTVVQLWDAVAGTMQVDVRVNADNSISVTRNGTVLGTSAANVFPINSWTHLEFKAKIDPSVGSYEVRLNGVNRLSAAGVNTRASANSYATVIRIGATNAVNLSPGQTMDYDDIIVWDDQLTDANGNSDINNFIGDCGLVWLLPTGAGTTTQWTPDSGSNYARVNEATPDGDTSYVDDGTIGHIDTYAMADLGGSASSVLSVAQVHYARKTDVSSRGMKAELRSGGGNAAHAAAISLGNSYAYYFSNWGMNPNNGSPIAWTVAAVNALEAGQQVSS